MDKKQGKTVNCQLGDLRSHIQSISNRKRHHQEPDNGWTRKKRSLNERFSNTLDHDHNKKKGTRIKKSNEKGDTFEELLATSKIEKLLKDRGFYRSCESCQNVQHELLQQYIKDCQSYESQKSQLLEENSRLQKELYRLKKFNNVEEMSEHETKLNRYIQILRQKCEKYEKSNDELMAENEHWKRRCQDYEKQTQNMFHISNTNLNSFDFEHESKLRIKREIKEEPF